MSWPTVSLKDIAVAHYGKALKKEHRDDTGNYIVYGSSGEVGKHCDYVADFPTLIIGRKGSVGEVVWAPKGGWIIDTAFYLELFDCETVDLRYLFYSLKRANLVSKTITTSIPGLNRDDLYCTQIPLPPLNEQKRIAAILDKVDAIRRKRKQAIQLANDFLRAVFLNMFGDPNSNSKNAHVIPMTEVFSIRTGSLNSNAAVVGGKYPFFTCAKEVFAIDDYAFNQEALLLAGNNAQADYDVKHYKGKFNAYQRTYVLTLRNLNWSYPFYKFALEYQLSNLKRISKGSNTKYITMEIMSRTMLPVPNELEQRSFVQYFNNIKKFLAFSEKYEDESENLFTSSNQKAFRGEL
ncbi:MULTISPECIES: restriction endonuclease subunit S [Pectobacterium]|uniref:restriction endonuclease subunit S n=1 Tax=Pectobacterium TaxID=122277 RepID=UPI0018DA8B2F|nr:MULTISPECIES: restriction endonuclease subunit S [Pectobacterium]QPI41607.1 restriction endonuclease subunit S [Pectobacterium aroidearum]